MTLYTKSSGVWLPVSPLSVKQAGAWLPVQKGYVKDAGTWKEFYSAQGLALPATVLVGIGGIWRSTDGTTFTGPTTNSDLTPSPPSSYNGLICNTGMAKIIAIGPRYVDESTDYGVSWSRVYDYNGGGAVNPTYGGWDGTNFFVHGNGSTGSPIAYSTTGSSGTWNLGYNLGSYFNSRTTRWIPSLSMYVCVGNGGGIRTYSNITSNHNTRTSGTSQNLLDVISNGTVTLAVGNSGAVKSTTDAITWSGVSGTGSSAIQRVLWTGTAFLLITNTGCYRSLTGGNGSWGSLITFPGSGAALSAHVNGNFIYVYGQNYAAYSTDDGLTWSSLTIPGLSNSVYPLNGV